MARKAKAAKKTRSVNIPSQVSITRRAGSTDVTACVRIGDAISKGGRKNVWACAKGSNPRAALAAALYDASDTVSVRRGAFEGVRYPLARNVSRVTLRRRRR